MLQFIKRLFKKKGKQDREGNTTEEEPQADGQNIDNGEEEGGTQEEPQEKPQAEPQNDNINCQSSSQASQISTSLNENKNEIRNVFFNCGDLIVREINISNNPQYKAMLVYIANLSPMAIIEETLMKRLTARAPEYSVTPGSIEYVQDLMGIGNDGVYNNLDDIVNEIIQGETAIFIEGENKALTISTSEPPGRAVETSETELNLKGPREAFVEALPVNISLLRKIIRNRNLKMERLEIGKQMKTRVVISYLSNIANEKIVEEIRQRLNGINTDAVLGSNIIEEYISDTPSSIFPTMFNTERPDAVASKILEGRVAIIVDGTPQVLTAPTVFMEFLQVGDDYYLRYISATLERWIRYTLFLLALVLPGFYVSLITFHQELIPTSLLITILRARSNIPFPALLEAVFMLAVFDALKEAAIRMPRVLGQAMSIVGALVLGDAAVSAGIASSLMVIVVAFTGIASFTIPYPEMHMSLVIVRLVFLVLGGTTGLLGLTCGVIVLFVHMTSLRSFGVPYMTPIMPLYVHDLDDALIRQSAPRMVNRPKILTWVKSVRRRGRPNFKDNNQGNGGNNV